jgi:hypothetical protein
MHNSFLLDHPPPFFLSPSLLVITELGILFGQLMFVVDFTGLQGCHFLLHMLLVLDCFFEVSFLLEEGLMALFKFEQLSAFVVVSGWGEGYFTILLLRTLISALVW